MKAVMEMGQMESVMILLSEAKSYVHLTLHFGAANQQSTTESPISNNSTRFGMQNSGVTRASNRQSLLMTASGKFSSISELSTQSREWSLLATACILMMLLHGVS